jgi:hypothetical protein
MFQTLKIGSMASTFLELPEERLPILQRLCKMIGGKSKDNGVDVSVQGSILRNSISAVNLPDKVWTNFHPKTTDINLFEYYGQCSWKF